MQAAPRRATLNPTLLGVAAVLIWGSALPTVKLIEQQIGPLAFMGFAYTAMAAFGVLQHLMRNRPLPSSQTFRNPFLYARWFFFVLHETLLYLALGLVAPAHLPFLILVNYLWPTAIILCSVAAAGLRITRWWALLLGSAIVVGSLLLEMLGPQALGPSRLTTGLFTSRRDCAAYLMVLVGAVSWGMYSALSRRAGPATGGSAVLPLFQATLAFALPLSLLPGMATWHRLTPTGAALLLGYSFLLFLAYLAWDNGMQHGNVVLLSLSADLIPWLSLAAAALLLHVRIGLTTVVSACTLVLGAIITRYGTLRPRSAP